MRMLKVLAIGVAVLTLSAPGWAHHEDGDEEGGGRFNASLVPSGVTDPAAVPQGIARIKIEAQDGGEVKMKIGGLVDSAGAPLTLTGGGVLTIAGVLNGAPFVPASPFLPIDIKDGRACFRGSLGLGVGDVLEITKVTLVVANTTTFVPGVLGDGSSCDHGEGDGDQGDDEGDHDGLARHHHGDHGDGESESNYSSSLVADSDPGDWSFDSAGSAFVQISPHGTVRVRLRGVIDPTTMLPASGDVTATVAATKGGATFAIPPVAFSLTDGAGSGQGTFPALAEGEILEIQNVTVSNAAGAFAVVGVQLPGSSDDDGEHDDEDGDGVTDDGDTCTATPPSAVVSGSGCSLGQLCGCPANRAELRACLKAAKQAIKTRVRAVCAGRQSCRMQVRRLGLQMRQARHACR
ncbi:MAG TPA: hypothetical protein VMS22_07805 [Candidatus Eisenbacteria bacterium]|nr:hypothetical protein [Candidatus Eisenbacteria bacterium]